MYKRTFFEKKLPEMLAVKNNFLTFAYENSFFEHRCR